MVSEPPLGRARSETHRRSSRVPVELVVKLVSFFTFHVERGFKPSQQTLRGSMERTKPLRVRDP
jgi:hypothetical protein